MRTNKPCSIWFSKALYTMIYNSEPSRVACSLVRHVFSLYTSPIRIRMFRLVHRLEYDDFKRQNNPDHLHKQPVRDLEAVEAGPANKVVVAIAF